jgi:uncharacterized glyoxalase superfamily protein PhnB
VLVNDTLSFLTAISITAKDVASSLNFYRKLGVEIPASAAWPSEDNAHHVAVEMPGGVFLEIDSVPMSESYGARWEQAGGTATIIFQLPTREAVDDRYALLTTAGHAGRVAPFDAFWGARYAVVDDPDGNHAGLMSPMEEQWQSAPPEL